MLVSIIVPAYNCEKYIDQCINSLTGQTYQNLEIICVNDGSTDSTLIHLERLQSKDDRIQVYTKKNEGKGAASARNMGLDHAKGEYVLVLDSDDFFEPDMVEVLIDKATRYKADVVITTAELYDDLYEVSRGICRIPDLNLRPKKEPFSFRDCPKYIFQVGGLVAWNKLFRRELLEKNDIKFEAIAISDDQYPSIMGVLLAKKICIVEKPLIHYRTGGESQSSARARHPEAAYAALFSVVERMRELGTYETVKQSYLNCVMTVMRQYFDQMETYKDILFLYDKFRKEIFPFLGAERLPQDYFYDQRLWAWYELITAHSLEEVLFLAARAYGGNMTTGVLRFQVPFEEIEKGSRVAVVGKGIAGRYWYAELLLSDWCKEIYWVDSTEELSSINKKIDKILIAK